MTSTPESKIASLLSVISEGDDAVKCPLAVFARNLREAFWVHQRSIANGAIGGGSVAQADLSDVLAGHSLELLREEESILRDREVVRVAYDKLRAEISRVEAQLQAFETRAREVLQQKAFCKLAMNLLVTGEVPDFVALGDDEPMMADAPREDMNLSGGDTASARAVDGLEAAPEVAPMSSGSPKRSQRGTTGSLHNTASAEGAGVAAVMPGTAARERAALQQDASANGSGPAAVSAANHTPAAPSGGGPTRAPPSPAGPRGAAVSGPAPTSAALVAMLRLPDVKEATLLHALDAYEQHQFGGRRPAAWAASQAHQQQEIQPALLGLLKHLPQPRPPVQVAELRILGHVFRAANPTAGGEPATSSSSSSLPAVVPLNVVAPMINALLQEGKAVATLTRLLQSVNDEVKCEVLECLSSIVMMGNVSSEDKRQRFPAVDARKEFLSAGGLQPLVSIVASCTSEIVLERSLVLLWGLISRNDDAEGVREEVRRLGGLRAVLDLLYTDSMPILENVAMTIGYITREEASKVDVREAGGLEKITATLRHPSESIQTKMAGAVWNCASNADNRSYLRQIGCIPALLELLSSPHEFVRENAAGALWNLSVDSENKAHILDYGGISELVQSISKSTSVSVIENASGTLWNCSAAVETRPAIRKAGAIPVLLSVLDRKPMYNGSNTNTNSNSNTNSSSNINTNTNSSSSNSNNGGSGSGAQGRKLMRFAEKDQPPLPMSDKILDNVAGTLRNCAINDQNKPAIREAGGVELLLSKLEHGILLHPGSIPISTLDKMASTLWILTISPEIKHSVRLGGGIPILVKILDSSSSASPSLKRSLQLTMGVKEKIVGILRNCSTVQENRPVMVSVGVVRALVRVLDDCYAARPSSFANSTTTAATPNSNITTTSGSRNPSGSPSQAGAGAAAAAAGGGGGGGGKGQPSLQLKETVASAMWYLSRDDKIAPREEGGLSLLCRMLQDPQQPSVVLEQAAGALSSLTVNSQENRARLREFGGLHALIRIIEDKAPVVFPALHTKGSGSGSGSRRVAAENGGKGNPTAPGNSTKADSVISDTYAVLNALLAIRNSTSSNDENLRSVAEFRRADGAAPSFTSALLYIIQHGSEDCAREAALCVKNLCGHAKALELMLQQDAVEVLGGLAERGSTDSVRRAAAMTLHSLARAQRH